MSKVDLNPAEHLRGAVETPSGSAEATFLLDDAADVNVISQAFVLQHGLERIEDAELPGVSTFLADQKGYCYGAYAPHLRVADSEGTERRTIGTFYAFNTAGPTVILGRP